MKYLFQNLAVQNFDRIYLQSNNPESSNPNEMVASVDRTTALLDQTQEAQAHDKLWTQSAKERTHFANETRKAQFEHFKESGVVEPEDAIGLEQDLASETDDIDTEEADQISRLSTQMQEHMETLVFSPLDAVSGMKGTWNTEEEAGTAEASIDAINPNTNIADNFLHQGDVSEVNSIMNA